MGYCTQCGAANAAAFCPSCGAKQTAINTSPSYRYMNSNQATSPAPKVENLRPSESPWTGDGPAVQKSAVGDCCPHCGKSVTGKRTELQNGTKYHPDCFTCDACGFDPGTIGGQIYWVNSEAKMYCRVCVLKKTNGQPINARDYSS